MGTKRPSYTIFHTVPNINMSDRKLQPGGKISRDPSPRPAQTAQIEREGDSSRESEWRRDRDTDRRRDKERYKDSTEQPRDRYCDRDRAPMIWDGERDRRQENRNLRPLSNIEKENKKEGDRGVQKGDTFPRNARYAMDQIMSTAAMEGREDRRQRRREDRERDRPRGRGEYRSRPKDEVKGEKSQPRDRNREFESRRQDVDGGDRRDRVVPRKNDNPREPKGSSTEGHQDRDMYWDRAQRREGKRDTRSEGEIDERQWMRERVQERDREELTYQHSRSEGDTQSRKDKERQEYRDQDRYRDKEDRPRIRDDRYRENRDHERRTTRDSDRPRNSGQDDRRYRERDYEQRRPKDSSRETGRSSQSQSNVTPRVPPRAQSSGELSSDMDGEGKARIGLDNRERREKHRHSDQQRRRKMWLEPQRGPGRKDSTLVEESEDQVAWRSANKGIGKDTEGVSVDGEIEEAWTGGPGESGDNTENSEGGSDPARMQDRDRVLSGEDGFVTLSSNGDDEEDREEDFKDCMELWEGDRNTNKEWTRGKEDTVDEEDFTEGQDRDTYVFCVTGQTLPQREKSPVDDDISNKITQGQNDLNHEYDEVREIIPEEMSNPGGQSAVEGVKIGENSPIELGTIKRDSQTERLLSQWRENNKEESEEERETLSPIPSNPYADVPVQLPYQQIQSTLEQRNSGAMTPEEEEAIRIRMSGAWSISEETKRHSQAPHLKWANNVVCEILGQSDENIDKPPAEESKDKRQDVVIPVIKTEDADSELEEEPLEVEGLRDDEDCRSKSWGEVDLRHIFDSIGKRKSNSKFFKAAQLYQQYSEAAQNFEILRQSCSNVLSVGETSSSSPAPSPPPARRPLPPLPSVPHPHSLSHAGSIPNTRSLSLPEPPKSERRSSSPHLSISFTQSATLWRDLPAVRKSVEFQHYTADQKRLQEVRFEVVTSEGSFCRSLDIVVEHFVKSKQLGALLTTQDRNWLFSRLADVRAISHSFLTKLEEKVDSDILNFTVCDVIAQHCHRFKIVYVPYLTNQSYQDATYQRLMNENQGFRQIVEKLERNPVCQRLPLRSFLVLPFQRITRIKLLVQNIVKRTNPGTPEAIQAIKALRHLEKLIQEGNDSITQMKSIESLVSLSAKVDFSAECKTLPLISQSRRLVREGKVTELMDFSLKDTERSIYMHLFNDYLLLSIQKEGGRFTVIDHAPVSDLRAENCRVKLHSLQKNLFRLHMLHKSLLLRTDTLSDKLRWISALSRPHPKVDFSAAQDLSQMQCIRAFITQQPDELSLEKADIILVHQQSDHWVEATRLPDRHRGWVPESHLETISNDEIRQRNLSDALKLTTATAVDLHDQTS